MSQIYCYNFRWIILMTPNANDIPLRTYSHKETINSAMR